MTCEVEVVLASKFESFPVLYTVQCRYWRAIHAEVMTHRVFSRNASSSRAIPVKKVLSQVWNDPAGPIHWGVNQPGMQARTEAVGLRKAVAGLIWRTAGKAACIASWSLMKLGIHKQVANRILEPWQYINVIITATDWEGFFDLRIHPDAQPEIKELAETIKTEMEMAPIQKLKRGQWHLPYTLDEVSDSLKVKASAARCARVSYSNHNGSIPHLYKDLELAKTLEDSRHMSPFEHQATPGWRGTTKYANLSGWMSQRYLMEAKQ